MVSLFLQLLPVDNVVFFMTIAFWTLIDKLQATHVCCIPLHIPILIKAASEKGSGHSPLEGIATPFPAGTTDCVWDDLFSSAAAGRAPLAGVPHTVHLKIFKVVNFTAFYHK